MVISIPEELLNRLRKTIVRTRVAGERCGIGEKDERDKGSWLEASRASNLTRRIYT